MENDGLTHTAEYLHAVKIRDNAISADKELKRNFPAGNRERKNYGVMRYMQRLETIEDADGVTKGILVEW